MFVAASAWFDAQRIPQDLVTGVVVTLIGLLILFAVKPRLRINSKVYQPTPSETDAAWGFDVTNEGRFPVIEVKARLFKISEKTKPPTRDRIALRTEELFQLRGTWNAKSARSGTYGPPNGFRFVVEGTQALPALGPDEFLLFQVNAKHGFTNFSRVALRRWARVDGKLVAWDGKTDLWAPAGGPPAPPRAAGS